MESEFKPEWWSWRRVLEEVPSLGIPHFQRGPVWGQGNRVALLESMYEASPCGSFVLWQPDGELEWNRIGIPLLEGASIEACTKWLVDGQQRTRSLLRIFQEMLVADSDPNSPSLLGEGVAEELREVFPTVNQPLEGTVEPDEESERKAGNPTWYVVLPALDSFRSVFGGWAESRQILRGSAFRAYHSAVRKPQRVHLPLGMVPLAVLLAKESGPFASPTVRKTVLDALSNVPRENETLDRLIPWGPQFLTGFAYEEVGGELRDLRWASIVDDRIGIPKLTGFLRIGSQASEMFRAMFDGDRFAVGWLPRTDRSAAIKAYVRINRAGVRVRKEEQALALLTQWYEGIIDDLGEFCKQRDGIDQVHEDQRALLVHESDKQMGFPIWMSTVTRYTALYALARSARHWLGVSAIDKYTFTDELERWPPKSRTYLSQEELIRVTAHQASHALWLLDDLLSKELLLDHRMARRDTNSLLPMLELLAHVSSDDLSIIYDHTPMRSALAYVLHLTMLHPYLDSGEMADFCDAIHTTDEPCTDGQWVFWSIGPEGVPDPDSKFGKALQRYVKELHAMWWREKSDNKKSKEKMDPPARDSHRMLCELQQWALEQFGQDVEKATNLQSAAVGWLYAIERRAKARELNWPVQIEGNKIHKDAGISKDVVASWPAELLAAHRKNSQLRSERQHIVPFSLARKIAGKGGTRSTASIANAVGNLTWLSARQNGFEYGLSDRWAVLDEQVDAENLRARGLLHTASVREGGGGLRALDLYHEIQQRVRENRDIKPEAFGTLYSDFLEVRNDWIKEQMKKWLDESLPVASVSWLVGGDVRQA